MEREEALELLRGGEEGMRKWNELRADDEFDLPEFREANLRGAYLREVDFREVDLRYGDLREANVRGGRLMGVRLVGAQLTLSHLGGAGLEMADLTGVDLRGASLVGANLTAAVLTGADLRKADLRGANLSRAVLEGANLAECSVRETVFGTKLDKAEGLDQLVHEGPSLLTVEALRSLGKSYPQQFLRGCGLTPWELLEVKLHDPTLSPEEIADLQTRIFSLRTDNPIQVRPIFMSYNHKDAEPKGENFIDRVQGALHDAGINTWRDVHDSTAGRLERQVSDAMRTRLVLIVLSERSVASEWVEHEVESAREIEKNQERDVLVPVALDDSWKTCKWEQRLRRQIQKYNVLDFSEWKEPEAFERQFRRLAAGLRKWY